MEQHERTNAVNAAPSVDCNILYVQTTVRLLLFTLLCGVHKSGDQWFLLLANCFVGVSGLGMRPCSAAGYWGSSAIKNNALTTELYPNPNLNNKQAARCNPGL